MLPICAAVVKMEKAKARQCGAIFGKTLFHRLFRPQHFKRSRRRLLGISGVFFFIYIRETRACQIVTKLTKLTQEMLTATLNNLNVSLISVCW